jgi:hypothetical protein
MAILRISYNGLSIEFDRFLSRPLPRQQIEIPVIARSDHGAIYNDGTIYEPPFKWEFETALGGNKLNTLMAIYAMTQHANAGALIEDYTRNHFENSPRTRAIASGGTETAIGGSVYYPARFRAAFTNEPVVSELGWLWSVKISLIELDIVPA